ncbi:MAG: hypothetical protein KF847_08815 [Pirellulales bacterium]|nr:hypothetical protein [Pirellulales bacterium]
MFGIRKLALVSRTLGWPCALAGLSAVMGVVATGAGEAVAITTSQGQVWNAAPDAWTRGNDADTSYFGWDVLDANGPTLGFGRVLDDSTPDLGVGTTAVGTRWFQGTDGIANPAPTAYGHRSGSANYYSGLGDADLADDRIVATAPASGTGGFTTVVLQAIAGAPGGNGPQALAGMSFEMETPGWTLAKSLYGVLDTGTGVYWIEWSAPGANLPFSIHMTSDSAHRAIDALQVDTRWDASAPALNARSVIGVPEPAAGILALGGLAGLAASRRFFRGVC